MKELGNNLWLRNEGNKYYILRRPPYQEMIIMCFAVVIFLITAVLSLFSNKLLLCLGSLFCLAGALFILLKKTEVVIDFDSNHILKNDKVFKWTYRKAKAISFQTHIALYIHIKEQSEGDLFYLCTDIQREQVIITKLSEPEEGNNLIKILQKKFPDRIEKKVLN